MTKTTIEGQATVAEEVRTRLIKESLYTLFFRDRDSLTGLRLLDLGCLEGGLSLEMACEDMVVLGVEGRADNYRKCDLTQAYFKLPNLDFIHLEVRQLDRGHHGQFDIVLCCGLLYHLDDPVSFLHLLNTITHNKSILFLDTHIAPKEEELADCICPLSGLDILKHSMHSYEGRWFQEALSGDISDHPWSAVSNDRSFWLTQSALMRALHHAGFSRIFNVYGGFEDIDYEFQLRREHSRLYLFAVKEGFYTTSNHKPPLGPEA